MEHLNPKDCHSIQGGKSFFLTCIDPDLYPDTEKSIPTAEERDKYKFKKPILY